MQENDDSSQCSETEQNWKCIKYSDQYEIV